MGIKLFPDACAFERDAASLKVYARQEAATMANELKLEATEITMGLGLVDVTTISHDGKSGILFRPRPEHIPVGEDGELQGGEYWPVKGDVVIWIENASGASVIEKYLSAWNTRPAAPVEGLETICIAHSWDGHGYQYIDSGSGSDWQTRHVGEELVPRSQAEAIIAAERSIRKTAEQRLAQSQDDLKQARADNAALTARVKELEKINANLMGDDEDKPRYTTKRLKQEITRATEALETQLAAARKALEGIASFKEKDGKDAATREWNRAGLYASGIARAALEAKP